MARKRNTEISLQKQKYLSKLAEKVEQEKVGFFFAGDLFKKEYGIDEANLEIVKQPKTFVSSLYRCSILEAKLLEYILLKFQETNYSQVFTIRAIDFLNEQNVSYGAKTTSVIILALSHLSHLQFINQDERSYEIINFFDRISLTINAPDKTVNKLVKDKFSKTSPVKAVKPFLDGSMWDKFEIHLGNSITQMFKSAMKKNFMLFPLHKIKCIDSVYALRYYKIALMYQYNKGRKLMTKNNDAKALKDFAVKNGIQEKNSWFFTFTPDELRLTFCLDENEYRDEKTGGNNKYFAENLVKKPIAELNKSIDDLQIIVQTVYNGRSSNSGIKFWAFWCIEIDTSKYWLCPNCRKQNEIDRTRCECNYDKEKGRCLSEEELNEEIAEAEKKLAELKKKFQKNNLFNL